MFIFKQEQPSSWKTNHLNFVIKEIDFLFCLQEDSSFGRKEQGKLSFFVTEEILFLFDMEQSLCLSSKEEYPSSLPFKTNLLLCFRENQAFFLSSRGTLSFSFEQKISFRSFHKKQNLYLLLRKKFFACFKMGKNFFTRRKGFFFIFERRKAFFSVSKGRAVSFQEGKPSLQKKTFSRRKVFALLSLSLFQKRKNKKH